MNNNKNNNKVLKSKKPFFTTNDKITLLVCLVFLVIIGGILGLLFGLGIIGSKSGIILDKLKLKLRVHIMKTQPFPHQLGIMMNSWVTSDDFDNIIIKEVNKIWSQANIYWEIESIIEENIIKHKKYQESINFIANTERDANGKSNPERLIHLYDLMDPNNKSTNHELDTDLFHIYLFPFIGNKSQGSAMRKYGFHSVVGTWSNKHNNGGVPEQTLLIEDQDSFYRGSLSRTIAHELGHVLNLTHEQCFNCLMKGKGYGITQEQINISRKEAKRRLKNTQ